jgi:TrkA domain protein
MLEIHETKLPGVGVRYEFVSKTGEHIGVILHRSGRRDVIVCGAEDPDACQDVLHLDEEETRALVEALGVSHVTEEASRLQLALGGLTIEWVGVTAGSDGDGHSVYEVEHLEQADASIVAVMRDGERIASPPSSFVLTSGDTAVLVGTREGVDVITALIAGSG